MDRGQGSQQAAEASAHEVAELRRALKEAQVNGLALLSDEYGWEVDTSIRVGPVTALQEVVAITMIMKLMLMNDGQRGDI